MLTHPPGGQAVPAMRRLPRSLTGSSLVPFAILTPWLVLLVWVALRWHFSGLYGQDAYAYYDYGTRSLPRSLVDLQPLQAFFWPLGYPLLLTGAVLLFGASAGAAQVVSIMGGLACITLTYFLGRDVLLQAGADRELAIWSAGVGAACFGVTGWAVRASETIMADSWALATSLLAFWAVSRWSMAKAPEDRRSAWLLTGSVAFAWSIITRWGQLALGPILLLWASVHLPRGRDWLMRCCLLVTLGAGTVLLPQVLLMMTVKPGLDLGPVPFAGDLGLVNGGHWSILHLFQRAFVNSDGHESYSLPNAVFYVSAPLRAGFLTPLMAPALIAGGVQAIRCYRKACVLLLGWPAALFLLDAGLPEQNIRFVLAFLPPIALLAGLGSAWLIRLVAASWRPAAIGVVGLAIVGVAVIGMGTMDTLARAYSSDLAVARWASVRIPEHHITVAFDITLTLAHFTNLHPRDLSVLTSGQLERLASKRSLYVVVPTHTVETQWRGRQPDTNFQYLQRRWRLSTLSSFNGYGLYRTGHR